MIIQNGYIRIIKVSGGGIDAAGYPVEVTQTLGDPIPCQYRTVARNLAARNGADEPYDEQSYTILIEDCKCKFKNESVMLCDLCGDELGKFEVTRIQPLPSVCQIKLYV